MFNIIYALLAVVVALMLAPQSLDFEGLFHSLVSVVEYILSSVTRYIVYIFLVRGSQEACRIYCEVQHKKTKLNIRKVLEENKTSLCSMLAALLLLVYLNQRVLKEDFPFLFMAFVIANYCRDVAEPKQTINYGKGMACSFVEGYLVNIIPSDGAHFVGFQENIKDFESQQGIFFPVKKIFIIITKDLFCHPDLKACNKENRRDLSYLEAMASLPHVEKDVAGVKRRTYQNSAYKIYRPGKLPVPVCAEFATPLHTLKKVLDKRAVYEELCDVDKDELVHDFCTQLEKSIERIPECKAKCVLVHYDNTDDNENLADVLLDKIRKIQPDFEELLERHQAERQLRD